MAKRLKENDLIGLSYKEAAFVIEFSKDFDARRAAACSGHPPDSGYSLRDKPNIQAALDWILQQRLETSHIDAEWVLMEAVDNHRIARQMGNLAASNTALKLCAQHKQVDAMASDKLNVNVHADADIMNRLQRGRDRNANRNKQPPPSFI